MECVLYQYILDFNSYPVKREQEIRRVERLQFAKLKQQESTEENKLQDALKQMSDNELKQLNEFMEEENRLVILYY